MPTKAEIKLEIKGLKELQQKADQIVRDLHGVPMLNAMRDVTLKLTREVRKTERMPVDTGWLRASITPEVLTRGNDLVGVVGSNVFYAPYQEWGWTTSKGTRVPGHFYLTKTLEEQAGWIYQRLGRVVGQIVEE